ncbi:unnamed protein product [Mesocestoides corti]|uniref:PID domain-containing protein n=1 Tax=Mesocestoides corti TaxID=53468 RepID=A0A0R3UGA4_MESCO|nr:unnamed protein product [Mesocestoides corti]
MSTNTSTAKGRHHKDKISAQFKAEAVVEGRVPIKPQDEVDIQGAREVLELRSRQHIGKSYKVKVIGTDTRIILKRKAVVSSAPRELSLLCNEVHRFFIFARDPKLVILVVPDQPEGNRAYLLLKMKSESDANRVCNVIQSGRKRLSSQISSGQPVTPSPGQSRTSEVGGAEEGEVEMQENGKSVDRPLSYKVEEVESGKTDDEESDAPSTPSTTRKSAHSSPETSPREITPTERTTEAASKPSDAEEPRVESTVRNEVRSAVPVGLEADLSVSDDETSPRSLPRTPLHVDSTPSTSSKSQKSKSRPHRREAPVTEEMYVDPPKNWKVAQPLYARRESELRAALMRDLYDEDWAVDVKLIQTDGNFGCRLSDTGNVYMFTAHHLVPENYSYFECSSSSDEEVELKEKPLKRASNGTSDFNQAKNVSPENENEANRGYLAMSKA